MEITFEKQSFADRLKSMLKVDFRRIFTMPLIYIMAGVCLVMPILILVMTSMMGGTTVDPETGVETSVETFTNVWQAIGSPSGANMSMDLTTMCNINLIFFLASILVCIFVSDDFRSGYAKNIFAVRSRKIDYVISKTLVGYVGGVIMLVMYFVGAMLGGAIAGLSFSAHGANAGGIVMCMLSKIFIMSVFVAIFVIFSVIGKQKLWLSILLSLGVSMLLFTMIPTIAPLNANFVNVILSLVGGAIFTVGLGALSCLVLNKTSLV